MLLSEALQYGWNAFGQAGIDNPALESGVLLCHFVGCDRAFLYSHGEYLLSAGEEQGFRKAVDARTAGVPLQHITGKREFMSLEFDVGPSVLIPRQETEILVGAVLDMIRSMKVKDKHPRILDMGTGSGCIAVSIAYYAKECIVTAVDISAEAIATAVENARKAGVRDRVEFICSNLFEELPDRTFDIIVSNPPYGAEGDIGGLAPQVRDHEPRIAIDGGTDGLRFYRDITAAAPCHLVPGGVLAFETGAGQAGDVSGMMESAFDGISVIKDLAGMERVVAGYLAAGVRL